MVKVVIIGVMTVFLAIIFKKEKTEFGILVIMFGCLLLGSMAIDKVKEIIDAVRQIEGYLGKGSLYIGILIKMVGITYVAEFGSNLCSDAGYHAVANQIEFYGKLMILAVSVPIMMSLITTITGVALIK